ncbi:1,2-phenylacetyl-CoA epoxidase subunit PaaE [Nocardioides sp. GXZ039]|uniref:1,2-phenylacetyl-CoA epoxidase subunit PaaE n=1 Tax=Nocardioides sp. GXZ039 TaxID=3136018 RepID=UPI0030F4985E
MVAFHPLRVREVESLTDDAAAVTFEVPADLAAEFEFVPGQSLTLRRVVDGVEHRRQYSISAPAGAAPRVGVREIPDGMFSRWLVREVRAGDEIEVQAPGGRFCPDPAMLESGRHLCIAAGSGITPMLSVASSVLASGGDVTLLYGNRTSSSVMFAEELADLKNRYGPQLQLVHVLSREPRDVELFSGRLDAERLGRLLTLVAPAATFDHVWLCGPHAMIEDARGVLGDLGVAAERVHFELFYVDAPPPELHRPDAEVSGETVEVTVVLDGLTTTAPLPADQTILDGAAAMRSDLPFACKGGVCGTCRAKVTSGAADMRRNYALEPAEVEAGFVLTCQSFPTGDAVTVDFDA